MDHDYQCRSHLQQTCRDFEYIIGWLHFSITPYVVETDIERVHCNDFMVNCVFAQSPGPAARHEKDVLDVDRCGPLLRHRLGTVKIVNWRGYRIRPVDDTPEK